MHTLRRITMAACGAMLLIGPQADARHIIIAQTTQPTFCPEVELPVCGTKDGRRVRYGNECKAKRDGATNITPGGC